MIEERKIKSKNYKSNALKWDNEYETSLKSVLYSKFG